MIIIILCTQQCYYYELFENLMIIKTMDLKFNLISFFSVYNNKKYYIIIGASLSEPHTNHCYEKIAVLMYVCMYVCSDSSSTCLQRMRIRLDFDLCALTTISIW